MIIEPNYSLEHMNTFQLPVRTRWFMEYADEAELEKILKDEYFQSLHSLHIGGGSNLLFLNDFNGIILHSGIKGIQVVDENEAFVWLRIGASEKWDDVVAYATEKGWGGIENLSLIPGETGAAAVQNIGAYGVEIKDVIEKVEACHSLKIEKEIFTNDACRFDYRYSIFKDEEQEPYIVTYVTLRLNKKPVFHLEYGFLKDKFRSDETLTPEIIRHAVIAVRREKLPDPEEIGNAGSFFMNPLVSMEELESLKSKYSTIPSYPFDEKKVKLSAAWLIDQCGLKGKKFDTVGIYEHQALVIVNLGGATGNEIALVAEHICETVENQFGIRLQPEVKYVG